MAVLVEVYGEWDKSGIEQHLEVLNLPYLIQSIPIGCDLRYNKATLRTLYYVRSDVIRALMSATVREAIHGVSLR